jgi:hypothetical protein
MRVKPLTETGAGDDDGMTTQITRIAAPDGVAPGRGIRTS